MIVRDGYKVSDVGIIPDNWTVKNLQFLSEKITVGIASAATHAYRDRGIIMFRNQNIKAGFLDDKDILYISPEYEKLFRGKRLKAGDLLTARTGYPGTTCIVPEKYEGSQSFTTLITRLKSDAIHNVFLSYYINSEKGQSFFEANQIGGGQKNVNAGTLKLMPIPIPATKEEQTAIATALSDTDALISSLEKLIAKKRNIKQGAMQQLLQPKEGWEVKKLGDVSEIYRGGSPRPIEAFLTTNPNGINWIKIGDVGKGAKYIESTAEKIISDGVSRSRYVHEGDFLLSNSMSFGRPYILKTDGCIHDGWLAIQNYQAHFDREFLYYLLGSQSVLVQYKAMASGSSVLNLNKEIVKNVFVRFPNIAEQVRIATILSDMDNEIAALETRMEKYKQIKHGMMQQLLTGKIRLI